MPGNSFIKFVTESSKALTGESMQDGHAGKDGWVEIDGWNWEITADTSFSKGTGAAVGKPEPGRLTFKHVYDTSSPTLLQYIIKGTHFHSMQIDMLKQVGDASGKPAVFFTLMAASVFITKVANSGGEDGSVTQDIECTFKEVTIAYKNQLPDGKLDKAQQNFGWNISAMNDTPAARLKINL